MASKKVKRAKKKIKIKNYSKSYDKKQLNKAILDVKNKKFTSYRSAIVNQIPKSTLLARLSGKHKERLGRPTIFNEEEEETLVMVLLTLAENGFGLDNLALKVLARNYAKELKKKTPWNTQDQNNYSLPGDDWVKAFKKRHQQLSYRTSNNLPINRHRSLNEDILKKFYDLVEKKTNELGLEGKAKNIFNVDETGCICSRGKKKVICKRGSKRINSLCANNEKTMYTVQVCCNADGFYLPLYVVYKSQTILDSWVIGGPTNCHYNRSNSGWMEEDQFYEWFEKVFIQYTTHIDGAKLLFLDGHSSHITVKVIKLARQNNIHIICLPPHSSHILQPLDVCFFKPFKAHWKKVLDDYFIANNCENVTKDVFPSLLKIVAKESLLRQYPVTGFEKTGIYPLNREKVKLKNSLQISDSDLEENEIEQEGRKDDNSTTAIQLKSSQQNNVSKINSEHAIISSVKSILVQKVFKRKQKNRKVKREHSQCVTADYVVAEMEKKSQEKAEKLIKKNQKQKRKRNDETLKKCCFCGFNYNEDEKEDQENWISCESCDNWLCCSCIENKNISRYDEFFCKGCSKKRKIKSFEK